MTGVWGVPEVDSESSVGPGHFWGALMYKSGAETLLGLLIPCGQVYGNKPIVKSLGEESTDPAYWKVARTPHFDSFLAILGNGLERNCYKLVMPELFGPVHPLTIS